MARPGNVVAEPCSMQSCSSAKEASAENMPLWGCHHHTAGQATYCAHLGSPARAAEAVRMHLSDAKSPGRLPSAYALDAMIQLTRKHHMQHLRMFKLCLLAMVRRDATLLGLLLAGCAVALASSISSGCRPGSACQPASHEVG